MVAVIFDVSIVVALISESRLPYRKFMLKVSEMQPSE